MERHEEPGARRAHLGDERPGEARDARDLADTRTAGDHGDARDLGNEGILGDDRRDDSARPEQPGEGGFETGSEHGPDTPEEELEPNFARGISAEPPEGGRHGRFSEGEEELPRDAGEKDVERRFSEGIERSPTSD